MREDWQGEFKSALKTNESLKLFFEQDFPSNLSYPLFIPLRLAQKIKVNGINSALGRQFLPHAQEYNQYGDSDPIGDHEYSQPGALVHRYHNRLLFFPTTICPVLCRYCFRKNELTQKDDPLFDPHFSKAIDYLLEHPEVEEIIFSGGDPFILSDQKIDFYLSKLANIPTVKDIRFHTRTPTILPNRINDSLCSILKEKSRVFRNLHLALHVNHLDEFDPEVEEAIMRMNENGIKLLSQTVLLKGVNDSPEELLALIKKLIDLNIRPYYLHHPDQVKGGMHFYVELEKGREIYATLRSNLPGWALPQYVIDIPGGKGKVQAFNPEQFSFSGQLIGQEGHIVSTPQIR